MKNNFSKYQGLGNDFIIFDARSNNLDHLFSKNKDNLPPSFEKIKEFLMSNI
jgi:diaminopimelate epimerase